MQTFTIKDRFKIPAFDDAKEMRTPVLHFSTDTCKNCGICVSVCPAGCIITANASKMDYINQTFKGKCAPPHVIRMQYGAMLCIGCFDCGAACPHGAISVEGNFDPGYFYKNLNQSPDMRFPKKY